MSEKTVKVKVTCPTRPIDFPGFWSVQRFFPVGVSEHEVPESVALALLEEVERKVSILSVEVLADAPVSRVGAPGSGAALLEQGPAAVLKAAINEPPAPKQGEGK